MCAVFCSIESYAGSDDHWHESFHSGAIVNNDIRVIDKVSNE